MKKNVFLGLAAIFLAVLMAAGCAGGPEAGTTKLKVNEADFKSDAKGILRINNFTSFDVAIFAGKVGRGNYLGAIHARSNRVFDITKLNVSLAQKGAFLFRAVSYETLNRNGKANIDEKNVIYTGLIAYDLTKPGRIIERDIFANIDDKEQTFIYMANPTKYVVELRLDSPDGEKVAVLGPGERNKKVWIKEQENGLPYRLFVTYVYVNPNTGDMDAFTDIENKAGKRFEPRGDGPSLQVITLPDPKTRPEGKQYNVAFIKLQNDTNGLINLQPAEGMYLKNTRGSRNTREGDTDTYEITADVDPKQYTNLGIEHDAGYFKFPPPKSVRPGYEYNVIITNMSGNYSVVWNEVGKKQESESNQLFLQLE